MKFGFVGMLGLNPDYPLLLSTVIEHAAATFGDRKLCRMTEWKSCAATIAPQQCAAVDLGGSGASSLAERLERSIQQQQADVRRCKSSTVASATRSPCQRGFR